MKLLDAIEQVKQPPVKDKWDFAAPIDALCEELTIASLWDWPDEALERLKCYPLFKWLCTDEMVGLDALYFDNKPVAAVYRSGRKMGYEFSWVSQDDARAVRAFLLSFDEPKFITILEPGADMDTLVRNMELLADRPVELEVGV